MRVYTEQEVNNLLSDFGNYLLSDKRAETIKQKENISEVHMEDVLNWGGLQARPTSAAGSLILAEIDRLLRLKTQKDAKCYTEDKVYKLIKAKKSHSNYGGIREIGTVQDFFIPAGTPTILPDGWLLCNGGLLEKEQFPELFAVIGDKFCYRDDMDDQDRFRLPILTTDSQNKA